jgi:putative heme-binding domain-containing protein
MGRGVFDFNFAAGLPRLWCGSKFHDVITATRPILPGVWTHIAMTRDEAGFMSLYLQGELNQTSHKPTPDRFEGLDVGATTPGGGTQGDIVQWRLWNRARSAEEIAQAARLALVAEDDESLILVLPSSAVPLSGKASIEPIPVGPPIQSAAEAAADEVIFARHRVLARAPADLASGKALYAEHCAACHRVAGQGADIGPVLDGVGAKGIEGLLRSILTPNAGFESGYRTLIVETVEGELLDGFLASQDDSAIILRRRDRPDLRIPKDTVLSMRFDSLSLMPEGLLDPLTDTDISDLLGYLLSL